MVPVLLNVLQINTVVKLLKVMNNDLHKLADDWSNLGVHLEVPLAKQQLTKHGYQQIDECRKELLLTWSNRETFTWMEVVQGLVDNVKTLGCWIAHKYGKFCCVFTFFSLSQYNLRVHYEVSES